MTNLPRAQHLARHLAARLTEPYGPLGASATRHWLHDEDDPEYTPGESFNDPGGRLADWAAAKEYGA